MLNIPNTNVNCGGNLTCSEIVEFNRTGYGNMGSIVPNSGGTGVSYSTTSDRRLKENIVGTEKGVSDLLNITVYDYVFKNDPTHEKQGRSITVVSHLS